MTAKIKRPSILVRIPGCESCGRLCKYNNEVADPFMAAQWSREAPYGCNSKLSGFEIDEGNDNQPVL